MNEEMFIDIDALTDPAISSRLAYYRKLKGLSEQELAEKCGLTENDIKELETDHMDVKIEIIQRVCQELGITFADLIEGIPKTEEDFQNDKARE